MGYTVDEARAYIKSLNVETKDLTVAQLDMAEANFQVKQIIYTYAPTNRIGIVAANRRGRAKEEIKCRLAASPYTVTQCSR